MRKITPNDHFWEELKRTVKRQPHKPWPMQSLDSLSPVKSFACWKCNLVEYSCSTHAPICEGGIYGLTSWLN